MVGYDREDLVSGRVRWTDLTPSEWLDRHASEVDPELKMAGRSNRMSRSISARMAAACQRWSASEVRGKWERWVSVSCSI